MSRKAQDLRAAAAAWRAAQTSEGADARAPFLSRVADNAEAIATRDDALGPPARAAAAARMAALLGCEGELDALQAALAEAIRTGGLDLDDESLRDHLRRTVLEELAIDQPRYRHGLRPMEFTRAIKATKNG